MAKLMIIPIFPRFYIPLPVGDRHSTVN